MTTRLPVMASLPKIQPLKWTNVRDVLPNEALHFTPWLASNLDLLAGVLGLDELELVGTDSSVDLFRLDIRATGTDGSGESIAVIIENQYNKTDHDHLGKLVTYAARADTEAERVLAVWMVEQPLPAHLAAIEFLNRISAAHVGWVLLSPRFVPSPDGFYVHFEKHAEPNAFLQTAKEALTLVSPERTSYMAELFTLIDQPLRKAGFHHVWSHPAGHMIRACLPKNWPAASWAEVRCSLPATGCEPCCSSAPGRYRPSTTSRCWRASASGTARRSSRRFQTCRSSGTPAATTTAPTTPGSPQRVTATWTASRRRRRSWRSGSPRPVSQRFSRTTRPTSPIPTRSKAPPAERTPLRSAPSRRTLSPASGRPTETCPRWRPEQAVPRWPSARSPPGHQTSQTPTASWPARARFPEPGHPPTAVVRRPAVNGWRTKACLSFPTAALRPSTESASRPCEHRGYKLGHGWGFSQLGPPRLPQDQPAYDEATARVNLQPDSSRARTSRHKRRDHRLFCDGGADAADVRQRGS